MRIAHVLDSLEVGGAERLVVELSRLQKRAGHEVAIHTFAKGPLEQDLLDADVPIVLHPRAPRIRPPISLFQSLRRGVDVVHCHNTWTTVMSAAPARLAGARVVVSTRHGRSSHAPRREGKFWLAARFCDRVVAVSKEAYQSFLSDRFALPEKLLTIQNGTAALPAEQDHLVDTLAEGFVLCTVGRLVDVKDHKSLLHAFAIVHREVPDAKLWMIGDGPERRALETLADELAIRHAVLFAGYRRNIGSWLRKTDLFVLSSTSEGLPVALVEAMAAGIPSLVTEVGGMPEIVRHAGAGVVVPPSRPDVLARAIIDLAHRRHDLPALGAASRRYYEEHLTLERMADRYMAVYEGSER